MSQPKFQLHTFSQWAGKSSDISYYLNSHHIDFHCWAMEGIGKYFCCVIVYVVIWFSSFGIVLARPIRVVAMASTGVSTNSTFKVHFSFIFDIFFFFAFISSALKFILI
jgi:hypothetical protein